MNYAIVIKISMLKSKNHFRRRIIPGNSKSLWDAVKIAKDINIPKLPETMFYNNIKIPKKDLPDFFAGLFTSKVKSIVDEQVTSDTIYNGIGKIDCIENNFMTELNTLEAVQTIKLKNCEGHDGIPLRIIINGI